MEKIDVDTPILYAIFGKPHAKIKTAQGKKLVAKKAHIIIDGKALCQIEKMFTRHEPKPSYVEPREKMICSNCHELFKRASQA